VSGREQLAELYDINVLSTQRVKRDGCGDESDDHRLAGRATPVWDPNSLDSGQAIEIVDVATTYGRWSAGRTYLAVGIELRNSLL
jgi:hypothetical protein